MNCHKFAWMSQARVYNELSDNRTVTKEHSLNITFAMKFTCKMFLLHRLQPNNMNWLIYWRRQCHHYFQIEHEVPFFQQFTLDFLLFAAAIWDTVWVLVNKLFDCVSAACF